MMAQAFFRRVPSRSSSHPMNKTWVESVPRRMLSASRLILVSSILLPVVTAAPAWQGELTSPAPGKFAKPVPQVLEYQLSWKGMIQAGTVKMEFAPADVSKPGKYVVRTKSASTGAAALLFQYNSNFWSETDPSTLRPVFFHSVETDDKETESTTVRHFPDRAESETTTKQLKSGTSKKEDRTFSFSPTFDIFSAMMHIRSQKLDTGDQIVICILPFDTPYLLKIKVEGREVHDGRNAIRLTVGMRKINRKTMELMTYKKLKSDASLWLSDDADRVPIELRAAVFVGDVRAKLSAHRKP